MMRALTIVVLVAGAHTARADSMKGWELYSWPELACSAKPQLTSIPNADSVCFALLPGTNRMKTVDEIKKSPLKLAEIEHALTALPKSAPVFWTVGDVPTSDRFDLPDAGGPRRTLVDDAHRLGLALSITPRPPNVGTVTLMNDGSLELALRSLPPGPIAETVAHYGPTDTQYRATLTRVGGLKPGETKLLPPWR